MVQTVVQSITALTAIGALVFTADAVRATHDQLSITEQGQITDRFAKSVEQLGSDKADVRLGAIHALERIMRDSPADQPAVPEILAAYARQRIPSTPDGDPLAAAPEPSPTSQAGGTVLVRPTIDVTAAMNSPVRQPGFVM
jgi:hypothetical protein